MTLAIISHPDCLLHDMGFQHPEQPDRVRVIDKALSQSDIDFKKYEAPLADRKQLLRAHDENYINSIFARAPKEDLIPLDPDTWMNPFTLQAALRAAGAVVYAVDLVMSGEVKSAFCNVRPPGHHAEHDKAMGFCFFNNVVVGAYHALEHYHLKRVAIVDFDVHHGNGTEDIVQNDERILYCSTFQSPFYPFSGTENTSNHLINVPLPAGTDGKSFRKIVEKKFLSQIAAFKPEIIFFSAGFDAYLNDPLAGLMLVEEDYAWITEEIKQIADETCQGRIVSVLEGGYDLEGLAACAVAHVRALSSTK
jgi:acetoin utilization deacetylase AcuC-like enzyme